MGGMFKYLKDEMRDKKGKTLKAVNWTLQARLEVPQQENFVDCGVFVCAFCFFLVEQKTLSVSSFSMKDISFFRRHIALSIRDNAVHSCAKPGLSTAPGFVIPNV